MNNHGSFIFKYYLFDKALKTLDLKYAYADGISFNETYFFDFDFVDYDDRQLDRAFAYLMLIAGISYYKAYAPKTIEIFKGSLTKSEASFFSKTYEKGLGEFFYVNKLDPRTRIEFKDNSETKEPLTDGPHQGLLVGIGGGKDSLVEVEALKKIDQDFMTWSLNHRGQLEPLIDRIGTKHAFVERTIDPKLIELNELGAYNGHIPVSAVLAAVGTVVAILTGKRDVLVGNEQSANEPTLEYQGVEINHQYSKSQEFERDYQKILSDGFGTSIRYSSFLRPLSELYIAEIFANLGFDKYKDVFSSCNKAYVLNSHHMSWCGHCPKCAFIFLILTPFVEKEDLESLWNGKNLLQDPNLKTMYNNLLGISGNKPLECVGEIQEARVAMKMAFSIYPELEKQYSFEVNKDYDYKKLAASEMPTDIQALFDKFMTTL